MEHDIIFVNGAPGVGKSTLCIMLGEHFRSPVIDFGRLREFHLDKKWERKSEQEEQMTFEVLQEMLDIYLKYGLKNIFLTDLQEGRINTLNERYKKTHSVVLSLVTSQYSTLKERITVRNRGWRDVDTAWERNNTIVQREPWPNEVRVDVTTNGIDLVFQKVRDAISGFERRQAPRARISDST